MPFYNIQIFFRLRENNSKGVYSTPHNTIRRFYFQQNEEILGMMMMMKRKAGYDDDESDREWRFQAGRFARSHHQ